jgi:photosystem II stability/assembly factor-like uncharacterized protein
LAIQNPDVKKLICSLLFLLTLQLHAQWTQLQDTSLFTTDINGIARIGDTLYAVTGSGVYYSATDTIIWKRTSKLYAQVISICAIGNDLFIAINVGNSQCKVLGSYDRGITWETLGAEGFGRDLNVNLYGIGNTLLFTDKYTADYSFDRGKSWTKGNLFGGSMDLFCINNGCIVGTLTGSQNEYYISLDAVNYTRFIAFNTKRNLSTSQFLYDSSKVYWILDGKIWQYDDENVNTPFGISPGLEVKGNKDTTYNINLFIRCGNTFYISYAMDTDGQDVAGVGHFIFSSHDGCKTWRKENNFPSQVFQGAYFVCNDRIICDYGKYTYNTSDGSLYENKPSIDASVNLGAFGDSGLVYSFGNGVAGMLKAHNFRNDSLNGAADKLLQYTYPLDYEDDSVPHNRMLYSKNLVSDDYGKTWSLQLLPEVEDQLQLIGYTANMLIACNDSSVYYSDDRGQSWQMSHIEAIPVAFKGAIIAYRKNRYAILTSNERYEGEYQAYFSADGLKTLRPVGARLRPRPDEIVSDVFFSSNNTLIAITRQMYDGDVGSSIYTYDTISGLWKQVELRGLPVFDAGIQWLRAGDMILFFSGGNGLYVSNDLGNSFSRDNTFPALLNIRINNAQLDMPRIGNTVYLGTNAGIWYDSSMFKDFAYKALIPTVTTSVYPNPASTDFTITWDSPQNDQAAIEIADMDGRICRTMAYPLTRGANRLNISTSGLRKGVYIIRLQTQEQAFTTKLLVE